MLPLLNLTSSEFIAVDVVQRAGSLVPEGSGALQGGFASVLQAEVVPAVLLQAPAGEELPATGNALPVTMSGNAPQLDVDLGLPLELSIEELDLSPLAGQPLVGGDANPALPTILSETTPDTSDLLSDDDGLPVTIHVPPGPEVTDTVDPAIPVSAADAAGDGLADALQAPLVTPISTTEDRSSRLQGRDRAIDAATLRQRSMASAHERAGNPVSTLPANDNDLDLAPRSNSGIEDQPPQLVQRRGPGPDAAALNRAAAEPPVSRDDALRAVRDDGLPIPRAVQPAAWQLGSVTTEVVAEPGQRMHADFSAVMPRATAAAPAPALPPLPLAAQSIDIPVQQSGWDNVLADRVTMMANGRLQNAELRLTPAELGPLRIQLEIDDGVANVSFQSQHPVTREALEQAMPRLRELLAENGLSLGQADVRDDSSQQKSREAFTDARSSSAAGADGGDFDEPTTTRSTRRVSDSLVDTFA